MKRLNLIFSFILQAGTALFAQPSCLEYHQGVRSLKMKIFS